MLPPPRLRLSTAGLAEEPLCAVRQQREDCSHPNLSSPAGEAYDRRTSRDLLRPRERVDHLLQRRAVPQTIVLPASRITAHIG